MSWFPVTKKHNYFYKLSSEDKPEDDYFHKFEHEQTEWYEKLAERIGWEIWVESGFGHSFSEDEAITISIFDENKKLLKTLSLQWEMSPTFHAEEIYDDE